MRFYRDFCKRGLDLVVAAAAVVLFSPLLIILVLVLRRNIGSPVIFRQQRPGRNGKPFWIYKFRTMLEASDSQGRPLPDAERLTPLGKWLRSTSLDEIPELFNVLRGDMSLVGPRPLRMEYLPRYSPEQARRHEVRPGITGWAQINGRNAIGWEEKFELDVWYVDRVSFWLDVKILTLTFWQVLRRKDISAADHATMPEFLGAKKEESLPPPRD